MGGSIILGIIRTGLVGLLCVLVLIAVWQYNTFEERVLEVRSAVTQVDKRVEGIQKRLDSGVLVAGGTDGGSGGRGDPDDPRTLAWWPTPDNLLVDPSREPGPPPGAPRGGTVNYYLGSNLHSLNDHVFNEGDLADHLAVYVYQYFAMRSFVDPDYYVPGLANRVVMSDDKRTITLYIRKGQMWHPPYLTPEERSGPFKWLADMPPQEVTAHDVKFTWDVVRNPLSESSAEASYLMDVDEVVVVDDYTVEIRWKKARYYNLGSTLELVRTYPRHIWGRNELGEELPIEEAAQLFPQHWHNQRMCGNGPLRFDGFVQNQYIRLKRNEDFWGTKTAYETLMLHVLENPDIRLQKLKAGQLDCFPLEPAQYRAEVLNGGPGSVKAMMDKGEIELRQWEGETYYYIAWNQRRPMFREAAVRRALAHAFPKERVIRDVYAGLAVPHDGPVHRWENSYIKNLERFDFDLEKAARLLDEAGWKPGSGGVRQKAVDGLVRELRFKISVVNSRPVYRDFSLLYAKELAKIGVILDVDVKEWNQLTKLLDDKEYDAISLGWMTSWDSDPEQIWHSRQADVPKGSNHCSFRNAAVDKAIEGLQEEFDPKRRKELWRTFQETIVAEQPYLFLAIALRPYAINTRLGNVYFSKLRPQVWMYPWYVKKPD